MIGRGLLARPTLAQEYITGEILNPLPIQKKIHSEVFNEYSQHLKGGEAQILEKIRPFWTYAPNKKIAKTKKLIDYLKAVDAL